MKKYLWISSAAVVIGALRVNLFLICNMERKFENTKHIESNYLVSCAYKILMSFYFESDLISDVIRKARRSIDIVLFFQFNIFLKITWQFEQCKAGC